MAEETTPTTTGGNGDEGDVIRLPDHLAESAFEALLADDTGLGTNPGTLSSAPTVQDNGYEPGEPIDLPHDGYKRPGRPIALLVMVLLAAIIALIAFANSAGWLK